MEHAELKHLATLSSTSDAVLTLAVRDNTVFAGHQAGAIKVRSMKLLWCVEWSHEKPLQVWDLDTLTCIRTLRPHLVSLILALPPSPKLTPATGRHYDPLCSW